VHIFILITQQRTYQANFNAMAPCVLNKLFLAYNLSHFKTYQYLNKIYEVTPKWHAVDFDFDHGPTPSLFSLELVQ